MKNEYTILEGRIEVRDDYCTIPFALVFLIEGVYYVDTYIPNDFFEKNKNKNFYTLTGKTEKGYDIQINKLAFKRYKTSNQKVEFICYGYISLINNQKSVLDKPDTKEADNIIYVVELEGLKMKFAHHTTIEKYRNSGKVEDFDNFHFDHTSCAMTINHKEFLGNYYHLVLTENPKNGNIIIDFSQHKGYNSLSFVNYLKIKDIFLSFLSFVNGGHVYIKKELTGSYITTSGSEFKDAQIVNIYSRRIKKERQRDNFIPIDDHHSYSSNILPHMFIHCFDKFYQLDEKLDLQSLVYSLNNSTQTIGLEEKYYILITALERLCTNYSKAIADDKQTLIDNNFFMNTLKIELNKVLNNYEQLIKKENRTAWDVFKSKIGNLNKSNRAETSQKMYELLNYAKININERVRRLVEVERNKAVHEGKIGENEVDSIQNYWKLDHILRDVILNLIEYKSYKNYTYKYFDEKKPATNKSIAASGADTVQHQQ